MNLNLPLYRANNSTSSVSIPIRDLMNLNLFIFGSKIKTKLVSIPIRDLMNLNQYSRGRNPSYLKFQSLLGI